VSTDRREQITARLAWIAAGITGVAKVGRNVLELSGRSRPAIVVWDGDETVEAPPTRLPADAPMLATMSPECRILAAADESDIGTALNLLRAAAVKAILADAVATDAGSLGTIVGANGAVRYLGCTTELLRDRTLAGELALHFEITYVLKPAEL
jgi:hypothetical protein